MEAIVSFDSMESENRESSKTLVENGLSRRSCAVESCGVCQFPKEHLDTAWCPFCNVPDASGGVFGSFVP